MATKEQIGRYLVFVTHSDSEADTKGPRSRRYSRELEATSSRRQVLLSWVAKEDLGRQVTDVGPPTGLGAFIVRATETGARKLRSAPGVASVVKSDDVPLDLLEEHVRTG